jgi:hypothetical protein
MRANDSGVGGLPINDDLTNILGTTTDGGKQAVPNQAYFSKKTTFVQVKTTSKKKDSSGQEDKRHENSDLALTSPSNNSS